MTVGRRIPFADLITGEVLRDTDELQLAIAEATRERAKAQEERDAAVNERDTLKRQLQVEREARLAQEKRIEALEEKLSHLLS